MRESIRLQPACKCLHSREGSASVGKALPLRRSSADSHGTPLKAAGRQGAISASASMAQWRNGATHMIFDPLDLIGKLAALVPPPRFNVIRYHGMLAPASRLRALVVPSAPSDGESGDSAQKGECSQCTAERSARPRAARRIQETMVGLN